MVSLLDGFQRVDPEEEQDCRECNYGVYCEAAENACEVKTCTRLFRHQHTLRYEHYACDSTAAVEASAQ